MKLTGCIEAAKSDELYREAVQAVIDNNRASITTVQRVLRIGYNRAARLVEAMEYDGIVSAYDTNGNRRVLVTAYPQPEADR